MRWTRDISAHAASNAVLLEIRALIACSSRPTTSRSAAAEANYILLLMHTRNRIIARF